VRSPQVQVAVNLDTVRASAEAIRRRTGVKVIAVIKADAYGLGAPRVADALASVVDEFAYFNAAEAAIIRRPGLVLGPPVAEPREYQVLKLRPAVGRLEDAPRFKGMPVALNIDAGMQRFGCPAELIDELAAQCDVTEYFCHADSLASAQHFRELCGNRGKPIHAGATSLLGEPEAWLDAVRPGLALYRGAVRVSAPLQLVRDTTGPIGYSGFQTDRVGVILAGYSNGVQRAPVVINGRRQQLLEIGMNTSFVTVDRADKPGDAAVLLGDGLSEEELAQHFCIRPHEVLCRYTSMGLRTYTGITAP
jgi:alanine racemase